MKHSSFQKLKPILIPLVANGILVLVLLFVGSFVFNTSGELRESMNEQKSENEMLSSRLRTLQDTTEVVDTATQNVAIALPPSNSSTLIISQIRRLAEENELVINDLSLFVQESDSSMEELNRVSIELRTTGDYDSIASFINGIERVSPIINLDSSEIVEDNNSITAEIRFISYYAPYPETLPSIREPITGLSAAQEETLNEVQSLEIPLFNDNLTPQSPREESSNPFESTVEGV